MILFDQVFWSFSDIFDKLLEYQILKFFWPLANFEVLHRAPESSQKNIKLTKIIW